MDFKMMLELYNPENDEHSIALSLPASDYQIQDALDQIRVYGENARCNISIAHCNVLPELVGARIDSQNVFEVNYFAHRLKNISENTDEYAVFNAVKRKVIPEDIPKLIEAGKGVKDAIWSSKQVVHCELTVKED